MSKYDDMINYAHREFMKAKAQMIKESGKMEYWFVRALKLEDKDNNQQDRSKMPKTDLKPADALRGGLKIIAVRAVGICSKCRQPGDDIIRDNKGKEIDDKDVACVNEAFGACKSQEVSK